MNVCWIVSCWKPITSGKRRPGKSCTSKISSTAVWNSSKAIDLAAAQVHHRHAALQLLPPLGQRHAVHRGGLADLRQADEGVRAAQRQAAGEAGQLGHGLPAGRWRGPRARAARSPIPAARAGRRASAASAASTGRGRRPRRWARRAGSRPGACSARQPPAVSVSPRAVTYRGRPSTMARPLRWQRSSAARAVMNGGRQRGTKL